MFACGYFVLCDEVLGFGWAIFLWGDAGCLGQMHRVISVRLGLYGVVNVKKKGSIAEDRRGVDI